MLGCNFIPVGGLDQDSATQATLAPFSNFGAPVPLYAPACNVTPDRVRYPDLYSGTSFAAPQVAGQLAAIWATNQKNQSLGACALARQVRSQPTAGAGMIPRLDGREFAANAATAAFIPSLPSLPLQPLACNQISVAPQNLSLAVGQTQALTAAFTSGAATTFAFSTNNPSVATVNRIYLPEEKVAIPRWAERGSARRCWFLEQARSNPRPGQCPGLHRGVNPARI